MTVYQCQPNSSPNRFGLDSGGAASAAPLFDLQLADLPIQKIDLRFAGHPSAALPLSKTLAAPSRSCLFQL
jgi:hypothetical protein